MRVCRYVCMWVGRVRTAVFAPIYMTWLVDICDMAWLMDLLDLCCLTYVAFIYADIPASAYINAMLHSYMLKHLCRIEMHWYVALRCIDMWTYDARYHTCHMTYDARYHTCHIHRVAMPHSYEWYVSFVVCVSQHASILVRLQRDTRVCLFFYASMFVSVSCMRVVRVYGSMHVCVYACTGNHTMKESRHIYTHIEHT